MELVTSKAIQPFQKEILLQMNEIQKQYSVL